MSGTRFVTAAESGAHPEYVTRLLAASAEDTVYTEVFSVMWPNAPHRVLRASIAAAEATTEEIVGEVELPDGPLQIPRLSIVSPSRQTRGRIDAMAHYAGQSVGTVTKVQPAADIVRELVEGAEKLLGAAARGG
jgi:NAD(P)H-dependent flavin oxidoreductase YrpB (nitropropane dioxygenase family)